MPNAPRIRMILPFLPILLAWTALIAPGCTGEPKVASGPPAAFELSLTVLNNAPAPEATWQRSARFVLESDGWLRAGTGLGATQDTLPPRIRRLTHPQRQSLWEFTQSAGLLEADCPIRISAGDGPVPGLTRPLLLITARTDSGLFSGAVPLNSELGEPYHQMVRSLTEWAWIVD